jgi:hypothetical protein
MTLQKSSDYFHQTAIVRPREGMILLIKIVMSGDVFSKDQNLRTFDTVHSTKLDSH